MDSYPYALNRWALPETPGFRAFAQRHFLITGGDAPYRVASWVSRNGVGCVVVVEHVTMSGECFVGGRASPACPTSFDHSIDVLDIGEDMNRWSMAFERALQLGEQSQFQWSTRDALNVWKMFNDADSEGRMELPLILRHCSGPDVVPVLKQLLEDTSIFVRVRAAIALAYVMKAECRQTIEGLLDDPSIAVRITARRILAGELVPMARGG